MKKICLLLFLAICCTACSEKSEDPIIIIDPADEPLIKAAHFYFIDQSHYKVEYKYNSADLLEKEIQLKENGEPLAATTYKYDNFQLVEQRVGADPETAAFKYQYRGDTLTFAEYKDFAPKPQHFTRTYSYPDNDIVRIVEQDMLTKNEQHIYLYIKSGNIVRTKTLDPFTDRVKEETEFEYDEHPNPYFALTGKAGLPMFLSQRNVTVMRTLFRNGESINSEIRYAYDYDGAWPVRKYQLLANNKKLLEQEYFYK
jgi:hypothetical protein